MAEPLTGEVRVEEDVPGAFARLVVEEAAKTLADPDRAVTPFRLGCSGGASGEHCFARLAAHDELDWSRIECFLADERCVEPDDPASNQRALRSVLAKRLGSLAGFHPMSCAEGPEPYERVLRSAGSLDLLQLGFGPDGHTASLFPSSAALDAPSDRLVARNSDPSGRNPFERLTLTYAGIALARLVVLVVMGEEKREAFERAARGEPLPAARVRAGRVVWLVEPAAAGAAR